VDLEISTRFVDDILILDMSGAITLAGGYIRLRDSVWKALEGGQKKVLLNLGNVSYIDSSGIQELVRALMNTRNHGGDLKLSGLTQNLHDLLQITKLYTVFDVFDNEGKALAAFSAVLRCYCPLCGGTSGPPVVAARSISWPPQNCRNAGCEATFSILSPQTQGQAVIKAIRIHTYKDEYFELLSGPPFTVKIVGRFDLFSSPALKKSWQAIPVLRRVIFDLCGTTEIDKAGQVALVDLLAKREKDARVVVSLEGLGSEQVIMFPTGPPFYHTRVTALAALGEVSDAPPLHTRVTMSEF